MILVLDTETTGLKATDQVIELYYHAIDNNFITIPELQFHKRYKPSVQIDINAFKVHNIGMKDLLKEEKSNTVTIPEETQYIIGANISFDIRLLQQSNKELNLGNVKLICIQELARIINKINPETYPNVKLATLYKHYYPTCELNERQFHSAKEDVIKTLAVLLNMLQLFPNVKTVPELYDFLQTMKKVKK
jgi:exodeoxyribonuclease X